mgnify:FL=1
MKLIVLSGVAGVGKSTYIKEHYPSATIISSDQIAQEIGTAEDGIVVQNNSPVFTEMYERVKNEIKDKKETIVVDATMLTRKRRSVLLNQVRPDKTGYEVEVVQLHQPLDILYERNKNRPENQYVGEKNIRTMYLSIQPPKVGLDCDKYTIISPPLSAYKNEIEKGIDEPHRSTYHLETLREHIQMTVDTSTEQYGASSDITTIAKYHDLGKSISREPMNKGKLVTRLGYKLFGGLDSYLKHQNVSAMYYNIDKGKRADIDITDAILHHMNAHNSEILENNKGIKREQCSPRAIEMMYAFREIDSISKITDESINNLFALCDKIDKQTKEYLVSDQETDNLLIKYLANDNVRVTINIDNPENPLFTFKYIHSGVDFSDPIVRNARGITLNKNGEVITIGFEKFFNYKQLEYNEDKSDNESTLPTHNYTEKFKEQYTRLDPMRTYKVYEKRDGTFISLGIDGDDFVASTSSHTGTQFSKDAIDYFNNHPKSEDIKEYLKDNNLCLFFEYTSPTNQIVIPYDKEEYTLIGARKKDFNDTRIIYLSDEDVKQLGLKSLQPQYMKLSEIMDYQKNNQTTEGYVVQNEYGKLIKLKTDYWFNQHTEFASLFFGEPFTERKIDIILDAIHNDTIDDYLAYENQRFSSDKYVNEFKYKWDEKLEKYKEEISHLQNIPRHEISELDIDKTLKSLIYRDRNGQSVDTITENITLRKQIAKDIIDEIMPKEELITSEEIDKILEQFTIDDIIQQ